MSNDYFNHSANVIAAGSRAVADQVNDIADEIALGLDKLPSENDLKQGTIDYGTDTGSANAYAVTLNYTISLTAGLRVSFLASNANTGASTLNVNGTGAKSILTNAGAPLSGGEISSGQTIEVRYDGTSFRIIASDISSVTSSGIVNVAQDTILGRISSGAGAAEELTASQARTVIDAEQNPSAQLTAFARAGRSQIPYGAALVAIGNTLDITAETEATWFSVGPTGSGSDVTWTALDNLPTTATQLLIYLDYDITATGGTSTTVTLHGVGNQLNPNSVYLSDWWTRKFYKTIDITTSGTYQIAGTTAIEVALDSNNKFRLYWEIDNGTVTLGAILAGFRED